MSDKQGDTSENTESTPSEGVSVADGGKTYTEAEYKAEIDRRVTAAVKTATEKAAADAAKKLADAEAARLAEQGEYKTLHEKTAAELEQLRTTLQTKEQREKISAGLRDKGLTQFESVLLADRTNPEDFIAAAESLSTVFKEAVDAEVARRLDTGQTKATAPTAPVNGRGKFVYPSMAK